MVVQHKKTTKTSYNLEDKLHAQLVGIVKTPPEFALTLVDNQDKAIYLSNKTLNKNVIDHCMPLV